MNEDFPQGDTPRPPEEQLIQPGRLQESGVEGLTTEAGEQPADQSQEVHIPIDQGVGQEEPAVSTQPESSTAEENLRTGEGLSQADEPTTRVESGLEAHVMANAEAKIIDMAARMEKSSDPRTVEAARLMREQGDKLAKEAGEKYRAGQKAYLEALTNLTAELAALQTGQIEVTRDNGGHDYRFISDIDGEDHSSSPKRGLTAEQRLELSWAVYDAYGVKPPTDSEFKSIGNPQILVHDTDLGDKLVLRSQKHFDPAGKLTGFTTKLFRDY